MQQPQDGRHFHRLQSSPSGAWSPSGKCQRFGGKTGRHLFSAAGSFAWPRRRGGAESAAVDRFGLGFGAHAHAPDEYQLIESKNEKLHGIDDMVRSYVDYLYALA
jgi:hypothetical protein